MRDERHHPPPLGGFKGASNPLRKMPSQWGPAGALAKQASSTLAVMNETSALVRLAISYSEHASSPYEVME